MILLNIFLILSVGFVFSLVLGAITSSDKTENFGATLRRGIRLVITLALLAIFALSITDNPDVLRRVADIFQQLLNF